MQNYNIKNNNDRDDASLLCVAKHYAGDVLGCELLAAYEFLQLKEMSQGRTYGGAHVSPFGNVFMSKIAITKYFLYEFFSQVKSKSYLPLLQQCRNVPIYHFLEQFKKTSYISINPTLFMEIQKEKDITTIYPCHFDDCMERDGLEYKRICWDKGGPFLLRNYEGEIVSMENKNYIDLWFHGWRIKNFDSVTVIVEKKDSANDSYTVKYILDKDKIVDANEEDE